MPSSIRGDIKWRTGSPLTQPVVGGEAEFFVEMDGKLLLRAADALGDLTDSNKSLGEVRAIACVDPIRMYNSLHEQIRECARRVVNHYGPHLASRMSLLFSPYETVPVRVRTTNGETTLSLPKTAGVHIHVSYGKVWDGDHKNAVSNWYFSKISPHYSSRAKLRQEAVIIGPSSGRIYKYGTNDEEFAAWRDKNNSSGINKHSEFRAFPTGEWLFDARFFATITDIVSGKIEIPAELPFDMEALERPHRVKVLSLLETGNTPVTIMTPTDNYSFTIRSRLNCPITIVQGAETSTKGIIKRFAFRTKNNESTLTLLRMLGSDNPFNFGYITDALATYGFVDEVGLGYNEMLHETPPISGLQSLYKIDKERCDALGWGKIIPTIRSNDSITVEDNSQEDDDDDDYPDTDSEEEDYPTPPQIPTPPQDRPNFAAQLREFNQPPSRAMPFEPQQRRPQPTMGDPFMQPRVTRLDEDEDQELQRLLALINQEVIAPIITENPTVRNGVTTNQVRWAEEGSV